MAMKVKNLNEEFAIRERSETEARRQEGLTH